MRVNIEAATDLPDDLIRKLSRIVIELREHGLNYRERAIAFYMSNQACAIFHGDDRPQTVFPIEPEAKPAAPSAEVVSLFGKRED